MPDTKPVPDAKPGQGNSHRELRALGRDLAEADDAQIARVVSVIDQMPDRGTADRLIEPLRPRLARMGPRRPLRFTRLLFLPLDPLIVPAPQWRPTQPTIPRSVLAPLAATVRAGLGDEHPALDAMLTPEAWHEPALIGHAGALLWPAAARVLSKVPPPVGWAATGLTPALYPPLARRIAAVLAQALQLQELLEEGEARVVPPRLAPIRAMLADVTARCGEAQTTLVVLLLARLPELVSLLPAIAVDPQGKMMLREVGDAAAEVLLQKFESAGGAEAMVNAGSLSDAVDAVRRAVGLLREITAGVKGMQYRARLQAVRQRLDASCRRRFAHALSSDLLGPLHRDGTAITRLEATARHLRELESEARELGGGAEYDASLRQATETVQARATIGLVQRVRLVEILAGPEMALALL